MFCFLSYWCWQDCWRCEVDTDLLSVHRLSGQSRRTEMLVVTALTSRPARGFQNCPALSVFFLFPPARVLGCPGLSWCLPWRQATPSNTLGTQTVTLSHQSNVKYWDDHAEHRKTGRLSQTGAVWSVLYVQLWLVAVPWWSWEQHHGQHLQVNTVQTWRSNW